LLAETLKIAERCRFDLEQLKYQYPRELVPAGHDPASWLRHLTEQGIARRWPNGASAKVRKQIERELELIAELGYESYFLTVQDIVAFARGRKNPLPGPRLGGQLGSVLRPRHHRVGPGPDQPAVRALPFPRAQRTTGHRRGFRTRAPRGGHPVRFHTLRTPARGADRGGHTYHGAGAVRDVAKALGLPPEQVDVLANCCGRWSDQAPSAERLEEAGFDPQSPILRRVLALTDEFDRFSAPPLAAPRRLRHLRAAIGPPWSRWRMPAWPNAR
ncbi:error-prone DNA polymerase, partial [Pseudomonas aeruginosa]